MVKRSIYNFFLGAGISTLLLHLGVEGFLANIGLTILFAFLVISM